MDLNLLMGDDPTLWVGEYSFLSLGNLSSKVSNSLKRLSYSSSEIIGLSKEEILKYANEKNVLVSDFKDVSKSQVLQELSNVIFSLNIGEISDIVNTAIANHIIILEDISEGRNQILNEVSDNIIKTLTDVQLDNFYNDLKLKVNQNILNGYSIEDIATENNLSTIKFI